MAALKAMGFEPEVCPEGKPITSYEGESVTAHVILPRGAVSLWAAVGFAKTADGYRAIIDDYPGCEAWLNRVRQGYAEQRTIATARAKGYVFQGREVTQTPNGQTVRLLFAAR